MIGLFYPNRVSGATVTGGSWLAARPVTKVGGLKLPDVARSTNALAASTKILMDLGASYTLRGFAMAYTNLSNAATWVVKVGTTSGAGDVLTTSSLAAWDLSAETAFAAIGVQDSALYYLRRFHNIYIHTAFVTGRYVSFEITDTANAAGYVDVGRAFVGGGYVPTVNADLGMSTDVQDMSSKIRMESAAWVPVLRRRARSAAFSLAHRSQAEVDILHELKRSAGTVGDVLYTPDTSDTAVTQRQGFIGALKDASPLSMTGWNINKINLAIEEIL